jgi:rhamnosyltransferase
MVSVVIPACTAEQHIDGLIKSLTEQATRPEIVGIDFPSADKTVEIAESYRARVLQIRKDNFSHGGTRNPGAEQAAADVVVFMTQDTVPSNHGCIENLTRTLGETHKGASYGRQLPSEEAAPMENFARHDDYLDRILLKSRDEIPHLGIKTFFSAMCALHYGKRKFKKLGGFPEKLIMFENMLFAVRLLQDGYKIACVPGAKVIHSHNYGWLQQFGRYEMAGVSFLMAWVILSLQKEGDAVSRIIITFCFVYMTAFLLLFRFFVKYILLNALNQRRSEYLLERRKGERARALGDSLNREWYPGHVIVRVFCASTMWHEYC